MPVACPLEGALVGFGINLFAAVAGVSLVTAAWVLSGSGTLDDIGKILRDPSLATELGFWPAWVIAGWTALLIVHFGVVLSVMTFGRRARHQRAALAKQAMQVAS